MSTSRAPRRRSSSIVISAARMRVSSATRAGASADVAVSGTSKCARSSTRRPSTSRSSTVRSAPDMSAVFVVARVDITGSLATAQVSRRHAFCVIWRGRRLALMVRGCEQSPENRGCPPIGLRKCLLMIIVLIAGFWC